MNLFTKGLKSEYGNVMIVSLSFSAAFAAASASSFPRIPTWLGTQQNNTVLFISAEYFSIQPYLKEAPIVEWGSYRNYPKIYYGLLFLTATWVDEEIPRALTIQWNEMVVFYASFVHIV